MEFEVFGELRVALVRCYGGEGEPTLVLRSSGRDLYLPEEKSVYNAILETFWTAPESLLLKCPANQVDRRFSMRLEPATFSAVKPILLRLAEESFEAELMTSSCLYSSIWEKSVDFWRAAD